MGQGGFVGEGGGSGIGPNLTIISATLLKDVSLVFCVQF